MAGRQYVQLSVDAGVGILQLNHPEKRNALGWELHYEIIAALEAWASAVSFSWVLLTGDEDYLCAGWRLDVLDGISPDDRRGFTDLALKLMKAVYDYRKPIVAAVAGVAPGYGMDLANMCDFTIASQNASFGSTQDKYGMNGFYHAMVRRVGRQRARRMLFTGDPISAAEALRVGLVDEVVPVGQLREQAIARAQQVAEMGPELAVVLKDVALRSDNMDHLSALSFELAVTHDLTQRAIFRDRVARGRARMDSGDSPAVERPIHA